MQGQEAPADNKAAAEKDERETPIGRSTAAVDPIADPPDDGEPPPFDPPHVGSHHGSK